MLEDREEDACILWHTTFLCNLVRSNSNHRLVFERCERCKIEVGLIGQIVPVGKKQHAGPPSWFTTEVPARLKQSPGTLKRNQCLASGGCERQKYALPTCRNRLSSIFYGILLIIA